VTTTGLDARSASASLLEQAARVIPGGVDSGRRRTNPAVCPARAEGAYLWDVDGHRFIDYTGAAGTVVLGYSYPAVIERVAEAIRDRVLFAIGTTEAEVALARKIVAHVPSAELALFCNSGSEATMHALRLARAVTGRQKLIKFQGCYHGFHDYLLLNNQSSADRVGRPDPGSAGVLPASVEATLVCRFNDLDDVRGAFRDHAGEIAAVFVEPVAHNAPGILPVPGFLEGLRAICDEHGAVLVFDEIITGFRHHLGGYQAICGVTPDLTTLGKGIANGFPIAVVAGRSDLMARYNTDPDGDVVFAGTYNGNAVGVEAALATLEVLEGGEVHPHLFALGARMREGLEAIAARAGVPAVACGYGSLFALCFMEGPVRSYDDILRNDTELFVAYRRELIKRGVLEIPDAKNSRSHLSFSHTYEDVDQTLDAAEASLHAVLRQSSAGPGGARRAASPRSN
jgi:glutamate-1-semialdehyde 2,1-aminomutase